MTHEFAGRVALVTGGSTGIGRATAETLAGAGAVVAICGVGDDAVRDAIAEMRAAGLDVSGRAVDVRDASALERLVDETTERHGGIDVLVNSAGIQRYGTVTETDEATWDEVLDVNLKGIYLASRAAIPVMRRRGGGAIVNVASVQASATQTGVAAYTASKGGILALTRAMAVDHAADGIRVNAVSPGSVDTPMLRWAADLFRDEGDDIDETVATWGLTHPLRRVAQPEEVAEAIVFLAGPRSSFITGTELRVDGGLLAQLGVSLPD